MFLLYVFIHVDLKGPRAQSGVLDAGLQNAVTRLARPPEAHTLRIHADT